MKIKIHVSPLGSGLSSEECFELYCGDGHQILQWVGYAACSRLAYKRGEVYGRYVPQSVNNKDGQPMDNEIVLNEMFSDGDELLVEYSNGPQPFRVRWEGRPRTPPFKWDEHGEVLPHHATWITDLDLKAEGLGALIEPDLIKQDPAVVDKDLAKVQELLVQAAGSMQMLFLQQSSEGATAGEQLGQITLPQFRGVMQLAKAITPRFPPEKVDEIFTNVATSEQTLARKVGSMSGVSTFDLLDFIVALVHTSYHRYAAETPLQAGYQMLSLKLTVLLRDCLCAHAFPDLQRKLEKLQPSTLNPAAGLLLKRGRKLVEHTLDSCQLKRSKASVVKVELRWLCNHLQRWGMLGKDFNLQELALIGVFAKQSGTDPDTFLLHPQPVDYTYAEFEKLLLGIAWHVHTTKKRSEPFEEYLGSMLDMVFKKAGVLAEVAQAADNDD